MDIFKLTALPGAPEAETPLLKAKCDSAQAVLPVFPLTTEAIFKRLGYRVPNRIIHVRIEKNGILEFGAYDNFDRNSIYWGPTLVGPFVEGLISQGILSSGDPRSK